PALRNFLLASASRPIASCTAARTDQARHQSSHDAIARVTSSKSVSATPLVTKRGPQCPMAEVMRGSEVFSRVAVVIVVVRGGAGKQRARRLAELRGRRLADRVGAMHRVELRRRAVDLQVENVWPVIVAGKVVPQLHLDADLEIAVGIEDAFLC